MPADIPGAEPGAAVRRIRCRRYRVPGRGRHRSPGRRLQTAVFWIPAQAAGLEKVHARSPSQRRRSARRKTRAAPKQRERKARPLGAAWLAVAVAFVVVAAVAAYGWSSRAPAPVDTIITELKPPGAGLAGSGVAAHRRGACLRTLRLPPVNLHWWRRLRPPSCHRRTRVPCPRRRHVRRE